MFNRKIIINIVYSMQINDSLIWFNFKKTKEDKMIVGFIGLGNLGEKLAATLLRNNINLIVHDKLKKSAVHLIKKGGYYSTSTC